MKKVTKISSNKAKKNSNIAKTKPTQTSEVVSLFKHSEVFKKVEDLAKLFNGFIGREVSCEIIRPRLQVEAVQLGEGIGIIKNFIFRRFKGEPHVVVFMRVPHSKSGGSFEPTDRLLEAGEPIRLNYRMEVEGASLAIYFLAKGYFLRRSFFIPKDPKNDDKCWVGKRPEAIEKFTKDLVVQGENVIELRIDNVTSFPNGPGKIERDVIERYVGDVNLLIMPSAPGWNQKSSQGNFFEGIRDSLDTLMQKPGVKRIEQVELEHLSNLGKLGLLIKEQLLDDLDHEVNRPQVRQAPNDYLGEINTKLTFLLYFKVEERISEMLLRAFPVKVGNQDDVYLPLLLNRVGEAKEKYRIEFSVFPRDLIQERSKKSVDRGLKFMPPYALHAGAENQNTFSKLLIILDKQNREDQRPEVEKVKNEKLKASVEKRIAERRHSFTDDKLKKAFKGRVVARNKKDER